MLSYLTAAKVWTRRTYYTSKQIARNFT